ncbi:hypothetical protein DES40_2628 [Litorimonas taeanensis]|uniref:DUF1318 domain-containing protein n=1 Tax=Litorimonas taeanensis TaxID=568099 RepID=A0A420WFT2_9PROT|nr:YdbL family protein [Litorimonas taeanensis]RKQ69819.1 hypothetical protein DES40_2628 [Litorimonas taeanensis]
MLKLFKPLIAKPLAIALSLSLLAGGAVVMHVDGQNVAQAQSVSSISLVRSAKAKGLIGETIAGYLDVVNDQSIDSATRAAMKDINIKRRDEEYRPIAQRDNIPLDQVARAFGEKFIARVPAGQYILNDSGQWTRK